MDPIQRGKKKELALQDIWCPPAFCVKCFHAESRGSGPGHKPGQNIHALRISSAGAVWTFWGRCAINTPRSTPLSTMTPTPLIGSLTKLEGGTENLATWGETFLKATSPKIKELTGFRVSEKRLDRLQMLHKVQRHTDGGWGGAQICQQVSVCRSHYWHQLDWFLL